jgi:hypothetical protein
MTEGFRNEGAAYKGMIDDEEIMRLSQFLDWKVAKFLQKPNPPLDLDLRVRVVNRLAGCNRRQYPFDWS